MTDAELRALITVLVLGIVIAGVGGVALFFIFRGFGGAKAGRSWHIGLMGALIAFVFAACALLLFLSYRD